MDIPTPQRVDAPLTKHAVFLVVTVREGAEAAAQVRETLEELADLIKSVAFRDLTGSVSCVAGIGASLWPRLTARPLPAELHPFQMVRGATHTAPSTPGDVMFHIRGNERELCFELERQLLARLDGAVDVVDETVGFRYFDSRDLLGFVDGTANPVGPEVVSAAVVTDDPVGAGGSYLVVQKYVHPLEQWNALTTEQQEAIIGRTKLDNQELDDAGAAEQKSHKTLNTITDPRGQEYEILRDNMPFGSPAAGEFGTYFIAYSANLWVVEEMLQRMFIGNPPGKHDRILDFSVPMTGNVFFCPAAEVLASLSDDAAAGADEGEAVEPRQTLPIARPRIPGPDGSLGIGALRPEEERIEE